MRDRVVDPETKAHKRKVASRIKQLGGSPGPGPNIPGGGVLGEAAGNAIAAVKGQVGAARAVITTQVETHLRNAQEELREEHVEIALYNRIEAFANEVGDRDTARLAREIRRDEERMARYLEAELPRLVKQLVRAKIPRDQRAAAPRSRTRARTTSTARPRARTRAGTRTQTARRTARRAGPRK